MARKPPTNFADSSTLADYSGSVLFRPRLCRGTARTLWLGPVMAMPVHTRKRFASNTMNRGINACFGAEVYTNTYVPAFTLESPKTPYRNVSIASSVMISDFE